MQPLPLERVLLRFEARALQNILAQLQDVLSRTGFYQYASADMCQAFVNGLHKHLRMLNVMQTISDSSDPKDDKLVAVPLSANVEVIVASDQRLTQMYP